MITVLDGEGVGAGKSNFVTIKIAEHLSKGGTVYASNTFEVAWPGMVKLCAKRFNALIEEDQFHYFGEADVGRLHEVTRPGTDEMHVLVIVDEAQGELNARDTKNTSKNSMFNWLCQSRHDDNDVIFLSQDGDNVDIQVRRLASQCITTENMENQYVPFIGIYTKRLFRIRYWNKKKTREIRPMQFIRKSQLVFDAYVSKSMRGKHTRFGEPVQPKKLARARKPKGFTTYVMLFLLVAVFGVLILGGIRLFRGYKGGILQGKTGNSSVVNASVANSSSPSVPTPTPAPRSSFDTASETFRGGDGSSFLRTSDSQYLTGEMSERGFVRSIKGRVAKIETPDGRLLYVVAKDATNSKK